jgi:hypothetical protein
VSGYLFKNRSDREVYLSLANRPRKRDATSQYRGVSKTTNPNRPFRAALKYKGRHHYLGSYETELEAAKAYNKAALRIVGEYAVLNDLPDTADQ